MGQFGIKSDLVQVYNVDLVMCIDGTGSMQGRIDRVIAEAKVLADQVRTAMHELKKAEIQQFRVRVVFFRDWLEDDAMQLIESEFYTLPDEVAEFEEFLNRNNKAIGGGGNEGESALEALSVAIGSKWNDGGHQDRHVVVLWSDEPGLTLEKTRAASPRGYPIDRVPETFNELGDWWDDKMSESARRLLIWAPEEYPWKEIRDEWEEAEVNFSYAGEGATSDDWAHFIKSLCASIAKSTQ